jgi:heptosyltransferase-3
MKRGSKVNRLLDRYIGIPALLAIYPFRHRRRRLPSVQRIAIMASPTLGDTLLSSSVVLDIRRSYPEAQITCIASKTSEAAVRLLPCVDRILHISLTQPLAAIRTLRREHFDLFLDLTPWQRLTAFYTALAGARYTVGFRSFQQHRHWLYDAVAEHSRTQHEVENFRSISRSIGIEPDAAPRLVVPLVTEGTDTDAAERIVFHPWASGDLSSQREWPAERWIQLAQALGSQHSLFVITGGPGDRVSSEALRDQLLQAGLRAETRCGVSPFEKFASMLTEAALVVSVNTGIMHLAAILGLPTVSLNGPTSTQRWGPVGPKVISVEPSSGGGFLHFGFEFEGNPPDSMLKISVDDVVAAALRVAPALERTTSLQELTCSD